MATLTITDARKSFGSVEVVRGISAEIADGEFVALVGPSGCGKSTLLRMIAGLEEFTSGSVAIDGAVVNHVASKDRDIAMVFQNYALYPHMTVAENMGFSLRLRGADRATIKARVAEAAASLELTHLLDRSPRQLSGGQRQRVAMGRAIVRAPKLFLFDEPLSNLDAKLRVQMRTELRELHERLGVTSIYVTHDQIEAMTMADRIVVLREGRVEQAGRPLDLYDRPANVFVAGFIGSPSMNLLVLAPGGGALSDGTPLPSSLVPPAGAATLGLRPEHLRVAPAGAADGFAAILRALEPTGSETLVMARLGSHAITVTARERIDLMPGADIVLVPEPAQAHWFDAAGDRIARA